MEDLHRQLAKVAASGTTLTFEFQQPAPKIEVPVSLPLAKRPKHQHCLWLETAHDMGFHEVVNGHTDDHSVSIA
jgi:hypothetical protein